MKPITLTQIRALTDRLHSQLLEDLEEARTAARNHPLHPALRTWLDDAARAVTQDLDERQAWDAAVQLDRRLRQVQQLIHTPPWQAARAVVNDLMQFAGAWRELHRLEAAELAMARARALLPDMVRRLPGVNLAVGC